MVRCRQCQAPLPAEATFCATCGRRVEGARGRPVPILLVLVVLALGAAVGSFALLSRSPPRVSLPALAPRPAIGSVPSPPRPAVTSPLPSRRRSPKPHRVEAVDVPSKKVKAGALPHKGAPTASLPPPRASEDAPMEATPLTEPEEEEQRLQAEASIDAQGVRLAVKQHLPQVKACYERSLKLARQRESAGGTVEIGFAITADGRAARVRAESNSTDSEPLARCLESAVASWKFPRAAGGEYELIYPFVFSPGS